MEPGMRIDARTRRLTIAITLAGCLAACSPNGARPAAHTSPPTEVASASAAPAASSDRPIDIGMLSGRIAFSAGSPHAEDVYVVDASGQHLRRVTTDPAADFDPSLSPDGMQVAYRHQTGDDSTTEIDVANVDGTGVHDLSNSPDSADWGPSWSPVAPLIAWNTERGLSGGFRLGLVAPDGSNRRIVPNDRYVEYPAWSPDGKRVAFMSQEADASGNDPNYNVYAMNIDGSGLTQLTDAPGEDGFPAWSPDGTRIAFSSTRDDCRNSRAADCLRSGDIGPVHTVYVMNTDGSDPRRVGLGEAMFVDWSPDGDYLVLAGAGSLEITRRDGSGLVRLPLDVNDALFPDWAP
jgi:Tol biopolymer transport system component